MIAEIGAMATCSWLVDKRANQPFSIEFIQR